MGTHNSFETWSNFELVSQEEDFDVFSFPSQPLSLNFSGSSKHAALDFQFDMPIQETAFDTVPLNEDMLVHDPFYSLMDFEQIQNMVQGEIMSGISNEFRVSNHEMHLAFNLEIQDIISDKIPMEKKMIRRQRKEKGNSAKTLSRATISKYFYMPIKRAAKEPNISLTLLKKRCRELGIHRWPHRKLLSLETLIKNVQEMRNEEEGGHMAEKKLREAIEILECEKKLMEEIPDTRLEDQIQRLRQVCFKANYNKRKLKGMIKSQDSFHSNFTANSVASLDSGLKEKEEEEDAEEEDLKSIIANCLSFSNANIETEQLQTFILNLSALLKKSNYKHSS